MLLFSFSIFSDQRSLKIENENNNMKTPIVPVYIDVNPGWLELPLTRTNFHGPSLFELLKFYCIWPRVSFQEMSIRAQLFKALSA